MSAVVQVLPLAAESPWKRAQQQLPPHSDYVVVRDRHGAYFIAAHVEGRWESVEMRRIDTEYWTEIPSFNVD